MNIENMGGRDQSQVKNKSLKSLKKVKSVPKTYQKVMTMTLFNVLSVQNTITAFVSTVVGNQFMVLYMHV